MSDLLSNILDGFVAGGTLALAGATVYLGRESARVAVDAVTPRVFVSDLEVRDRPVIDRADWLRPKGDLKAPEPGSMWSLKNNGDTPLGLIATCNLTNESAITALVRFSGQPSTRLSSAMAVEDPSMEVAAERQGEWCVVRPGSIVRCKILWTRHAADWANDWEHGDSPPGAMPVNTVTVTIRGATAEAIDTCELRFGTHVLARDDNEFWVIGAQGGTGPGEVPSPVAEIGLMRRTYSGSLLRRRR